MKFSDLPPGVSVFDEHINPSDEKPKKGATKLPEWVNYVAPEIARELLLRANDDPSLLGSGADVLVERVHPALVVADAEKEREKESEKHMEPPAPNSNTAPRYIADEGSIKNHTRYVTDAERAELRERFVDDDEIFAVVDRMDATIAALLEVAERKPGANVAEYYEGVRAFAAQIRGQK